MCELTNDPGELAAVLKPVLQRSAQALRIAERSGERCGAPVLIAGLVVGIGVVELGCARWGKPAASAWNY